jgi:hypothetical protein
MTSATHITQWSSLLEAFASFNVAEEDAPTILEVAGYPHYENVCSNILAFFLDPAQEHGLKDLALLSLLECARQTVAMSNVSIEREVSTGNGRIDLLISADECLVAIENKIFHTLANDLTDYRRHVQNLAGRRRSILLILGLANLDHCTYAGFTCLTYTDYFACIRKNIGPYLSGADHKFLVFFLDFMQSIEHLIAGGTMSNELRAFFRDHGPQVRLLLKAWNSLRTDLRDKVKQLDGLVHIDAPVGMTIRKSVFRESQELYDVLVHDITADYLIAVDCWISPDGWNINVFDRGKGNMERIKQLLSECGIEYDFTADRRCNLRFHAEYDAPIELIAEKLCSVLNELMRRLSHCNP